MLDTDEGYVSCVIFRYDADRCGGGGTGKGTGTGGGAGPDAGGKDKTDESGGPYQAKGTGHAGRDMKKNRAGASGGYLRRVFNYSDGQ